MSKQWTHKVVRRNRGMDGELFDYPTAATFDSEEEAMQYAANWVAKQPNLYLSVRSRRAVPTVYGHKTHTVATWSRGKLTRLIDGDWVAIITDPHHHPSAP